MWNFMCVSLVQPIVLSWQMSSRPNIIIIEHWFGAPCWPRLPISFRNSPAWSLFKQSTNPSWTQLWHQAMAHVSDVWKSWSIATNVLFQFKSILSKWSEPSNTPWDYPSLDCTFQLHRPTWVSRKRLHLLLNKESMMPKCARCCKIVYLFLTKWLPRFNNKGHYILFLVVPRHS